MIAPPCASIPPLICLTPPPPYHAPCADPRDMSSRPRLCVNVSCVAPSTLGFAELSAWGAFTWARRDVDEKG
eukprot:1571122-Pyramimonas_sp.AAC.1